MTEPKVLAVVLAGGKGSRLDVLTEKRAKPTLPFGGINSLLDVCLSNLVNSGIDDVWVVVQYHASSLDGVLVHGRPWDLDRNRGGLRVIGPQEGIGEHEAGMATGNADSLFRIRELVAQHAPDVVAVLSADHVYRLDHREALAAHVETGAECTVVTTGIDVSEACHHTVVHTRKGRVAGIDQKPDQPAHGTVAAEVFLYDAAVLRQVLDDLHERLVDDADDGDTGLGDFAEHLLPELVSRGKTYAFPLDGYWRDLGRPSAYLRAHLDLLAGDVDVLGDPAWPMSTATPQGPAVRVVEGAVVADALLGDGARIEGEVRRSVIGPGCVVERGALVHDAVLMRNVHVHAGARVGWSVLDEDVTVGDGARVGAEDEPGGDERLLSEHVTLVGMGAEVPEGTVLEPGARVEPAAGIG